MKKLYVFGVAVVTAALAVIGFALWPSGSASAAGTVTLSLNQTVLVASNIDVAPGGATQMLPGVFITKACPHPSFYNDSPPGGQQVGVSAYVAGLVGQSNPVWAGGTSTNGQVGVVGAPNGISISAPSLSFGLWHNTSDVTAHLDNLYLFCGK